MKSQPNPNEIYAVIQVTIRRGGARFLVDVTVLKRPAALPDIPGGQGEISNDLFDSFEESFPTKLAEDIGTFEPSVLNQAEISIVNHAQVLEQVLWGEAVWNKSEDKKAVWNEIDEKRKTWWRNLIAGSRGGYVSVIELDLCREMRRFIWEALLVTQDFPLNDVSIVRIPDVGQDVRAAFTMPLRRALFPDPRSDLVALHTHCRARVMKQGWKVVERLSGNSSLDALSDDLRNENSKELAFLYVGHGQATQHSMLFVMEDKRGQDDLVMVERLRTAFCNCKPVVLILVACWLGGGQVSSDPLFNMSVITVAMQLPLSPDAAERFIDGFFDHTFKNSKKLSLIEVLKRVKEARRELHNGEYSHIEAAIPVIYSRVPFAALELEIPAAVPGPEIIIVIRIRDWINELLAGQQVDCEDLIELVMQANDNDLSLLTDPEREFISFAIMHYVSRKLG
jgi:hypothetical protein